MKTYSILFIALLIQTTISISSQNDTPIIVCKSCELVHERTYFLERLDKIIYLFKKFNASPKINTNFTGFSPEKFSHPCIKDLIISLENGTDLDPFFKLWGELYEYKYINDEKLIKEFTQFTLLLTKKLCPACYTKSLRNPDIAYNLPNGNYTESITLRMYCTKRLRRPLELLSHARCNKTSLFEIFDPETACNCIFETKIKFEHPEINKCIQRMSETNSLKPLFNLSQEFNSFRLIQDEEFNKEFLLMVFTVYKNLVTYNANHKHLVLNKSTLSMIAHLYDNLDSLPMEQILDAIDLLSQELPSLMEKYELESDLSWKEWFKKYWWAPPLIASALGIKIFLIFKLSNHSSSPSSVASPPPSPHVTPPSSPLSSSRN